MMYNFDVLNGKRIGFAFTGSFCTILKALEQIKILVSYGAVVIPIFSDSVATMDTDVYKRQPIRLHQ